MLLLAKKRGLIETIREPIEALRFGGFRATDDLYDEVLAPGRREGLMRAVATAAEPASPSLSGFVPSYFCME